MSEKAKNFSIAFTLVLLYLGGGLYLANYFKLSDFGAVKRVAPDYLYPDPKLTPGKADTLNINDLTASYGGLTYSQAHRAVSSSEKAQVCKEYPDNCKVSNEKDHLYMLCGGGSNSIENIWAQPEHNLWNGVDYGFHTKDKLESYLCIQIKAKKITPQDAYSCIVNDWVNCYNKYIGQSFGSMNDFYDSEDEVQL